VRGVSVKSRTRKRPNRKFTDVLKVMASTSLAPAKNSTV
jgi:hypothetical protein